MKKSGALLFTFAAVLAASLPADTTARSNLRSAAVAVPKEFSDSLKLRADMADAIVGGREKCADALRRLKTCAVATGLKIPRSADFGFAAMDVGQRLLRAGHPSEAEVFFRESEESLAQAVTQTPDTEARDKAQLLRKLSFLRGRYLNKVPQARADIERAIALQPADLDLKIARASLATENADYFKNNTNK